MGPRPAEAQLTVNNIYFYGPLGQYLLCTYLFINYNVHTSVFFCRVRSPNIAKIKRSSVSEQFSILKEAILIQ